MKSNTNTNTNTNKEWQRSYYNKYFKEYESSVSRTHSLLKTFTINVWKNKCKGKEILELGCGNAYVLSELQRATVDFKSYTGIDISDEMIKSNSNSYKALKNVSFFVDDAENLEKLDDRKYDVIISYGCLHHLERPVKAIKSAYNKLRYDGLFFAVEMNRGSLVTTFPYPYSLILGLDVEKSRNTLKRIKNTLRKITNKPFRSHSKSLSKYPIIHPGHPGSRTPTEYKVMLQSAGFRAMGISCLFVELFPKSLYRSSVALFRLMVELSKPFLRRKRLQNLGNIILVEAKK